MSVFFVLLGIAGLFITSYCFFIELLIAPRSEANVFWLTLNFMGMVLNLISLVISFVEIVGRDKYAESKHK